MVPGTLSRGHRLQLGVAVALLAALVVGAFAIVRAQGRSCRDIQQVTVCADQFAADVPGFTNASGNITIARKGREPYVTARAVDGKPARFLHDANSAESSSAGALVGAVTLTRDSQALPLVTTSFGSNGQPNAYLEVSMLSANVFEATEAIANLPEPDFSKLKANYLDRFGIRSIAKDNIISGGTSYLFNSTTRTFSGFNSVVLRLEGDENPDILINLETTFDEQGKLGGKVKDFSVRLAGLMVSLKTITFGKSPTSGKPFFEAALANVLKANNPGLPGLTNDASLVFALEKVRYEDGKFSIGGGEVPIRDWQIGGAFALINQRIGLSFDATTKTSFFTVKSTLRFTNSGSQASPLTGDSTQAETKIPIVLKIGTTKVNGSFRPVFQAGLQDMSLKLSQLKLKLKGVTFVGDTSQDFFGLKATAVDVSWPSALGGQTSAGISGFQLGTNKSASLVFALAGGQITTPPLKSGVLEGSNLKGTIKVEAGRIELNVKGSGKIRIPGNAAALPTIDLFLRGGKNTGSGSGCVAPSCLKRYEMKLSGFGLRLAGFELNLVSPRGTEDGGFAADTATLKVPTGVNLGSAGFTLNGLTISGTGAVSVAGGGFELPPIEIAGFQFVAARGNFQKLPDGNYEFSAGATLPLPGLEPSGGKKISAELKIRTTGTGAFAGFGVKVSFQARPGIPISGTGLELTGIGGSFDLNSNTVQIGVDLRAESTLRLIGVPLVALDGSVVLKPQPFAITANARLSLLIFTAAQATMGLGDGQGFSGGKGFNASVQMNAVIVKGEVKVRVGKVLVSGVEKLRFAASARFQVAIEKGQFGFALPPVNINLASVSFQGGRFKDKRGSTVRETAGMLGTVSVGPFSGSVFVDLAKQPGSGDFISLVNASKFELIDALRARQRAAQGVDGYASVVLTPEQAARLGLDASAGAPLIQDTFPVTQTRITTLVAGVHYTAGNPIISLRLPNGSIITEQTADGSSQFFLRDLSAEKGNDVVFIIKGAAPGSYSLIVDNAPADYTHVSYELNELPTVAVGAASCGGPAIAGVSVQCDGAAAGGSVDLSWTAADIDSPDALVTVGYVAVPAGGGDPDPANLQALAEDQPLGAGSLTWELGEVPTGSYRLLVRVEDGSNAPVDALSELVVTVADGRAPATPTDLSAGALPAELLMSWTPNAERDLAGYEIGFGVVAPGQADDPASFVYQRDMGAKELAGGASSLDAKIWGLNDNQEVFVGIRAYDLSGNRSDWALIRATPWALAPDGWTPLPDGSAAGGTSVAVAFATPLLEASLAGALELRDAGGSLVSGTTELITTLEGDAVIGLRFTPDAPLAAEAAYTATLAGGPGGIQALDGRTMPADYSWRFRVVNTSIYLPMLMQ